MTITLNGTTGISNDGGYTGDGVSFADTTPANTLVTTTGGNVGIGTSSPASFVNFTGATVSGATGGFVRTVSTTGSIAGVFSSDNNSSSVNIGSDSAHPLVLKTNNTQRVAIDTSGNFSVTQAAGKYSLDTTGSTTLIANGGTVDFPSASGMLIVNNHTSGHVTTWLCGAGLTSAIGSVGGTVGSFAYVSGINGYRWTNNSGSSAYFAFCFIRTRTGA